MRVFNTLGFAALVASLLAAPGCGEPNPLKGATLYATKGKITLADGKPLSSGSVVFVGLKNQLTSKTALGPGGEFEFKSPSGDGLPEGEYRVVVEPLPGTSAKGTGLKAKPDLPYASSYTDEDGSDLKATVTSDASKNNFEFKLEPKNSAKVATSHSGGR
jgi:hypothetical protein